MICGSTYELAIVRSNLQISQLNSVASSSLRNFGGLKESNDNVELSVCSSLSSVVHLRCSLIIACAM